MRPKKHLSNELIESIKLIRDNSKTIHEYSRSIIVLLRTELDLSAPKIAKAIGWHVVSARQLHSKVLKEGASAVKCMPKGGRKRYNFTQEQEKELLQPFIEKAQKGGMLLVNEVHHCYEKSLGHKVAKSTIYRMLARHGWRKIVPRPKHPKSDREIQEEYKKTPGGHTKRI